MGGHVRHELGCWNQVYIYVLGGEGGDGGGGGGARRLWSPVCRHRVEVIKREEGERQFNVPFCRFIDCLRSLR